MVLSQGIVDGFGSIIIIILFSNIYTGYFTYLHKYIKNIHQQNKLLLSVYDLCVKTLKE